MVIFSSLLVSRLDRVYDLDTVFDAGWKGVTAEGKVARRLAEASETDSIGDRSKRPLKVKYEDRHYIMCCRKLVIHVSWKVSSLYASLLCVGSPLYLGVGSPLIEGESQGGVPFVPLSP